MRRMQGAGCACRTCARACIAVELARSSSGHVQTASLVLNGLRSASDVHKQQGAAVRSRWGPLLRTQQNRTHERVGSLAARLQLIRGLAASGDAPGDAARGIDDAAADAGLGDPEGWRFRSASQRTKRLALRDVLQVCDAWHHHGSARSAHAGRCSAELDQAPACPGCSWCHLMASHACLPCRMHGSSVAWAACGGSCCTLCTPSCSSASTGARTR